MPSVTEVPVSTASAVSEPSSSTTPAAATVTTAAVTAPTPSVGAISTPTNNKKAMKTKTTDAKKRKLESGQEDSNNELAEKYAALSKKCEFYESEFCELQRLKQEAETQHTSEKADFRRILAKKEDQMESEQKIKHWQAAGSYSIQCHDRTYGYWPGDA